MPLRKNQQVKHLSWFDVEESLKDLRDKIQLRTTPKMLYVNEHGDQVFGSLLASYLNVPFYDNREARAINLISDHDTGKVFFTNSNSLHNFAPDNKVTNVVYVNYMNEDAGVDYQIPDIYHEELNVPLDDVHTRYIFPWQK